MIIYSGVMLHNSEKGVYFEDHIPRRPISFVPVLRKNTVHMINGDSLMINLSDEAVGTEVVGIGLFETTNQIYGPWIVIPFNHTTAYINHPGSAISIAQGDLFWTLEFSPNLINTVKKFTNYQYLITNNKPMVESSGWTK